MPCALGNLRCSLDALQSFKTDSAGEFYRFDNTSSMILL